MGEKGGGILKRWLILILVLFTVSCLPICAFAHPGNTNDDGGHYDRSTGEYHYHHGYPAHDHYDMDGDGIIDCPYDFDDKTGENSGSSSSGGGHSYSYSAPEETIHWIPETIYRVPETSESKPAPTEPKREVVTGNMGAIYTAVVMFVVGAIVMAVQASSHRDEKNRLETLNQEKTLENQRLNRELSKANSIHESDEKIISSLQAEVSRLSGADRKCETYKERYDTLLEVVRRKNQGVVLDEYSIQAPVSKEILDKLNCKIDIPEHTFFTEEGLPVFLDRHSRYPYGEYTVFTVPNGSIYHADSYCAGYKAQPIHLFYTIIQGKRICKKCANQLRVPNVIPDWYFDLQAARSYFKEE